MAGDHIKADGVVIKACGNANFLVNVPDFNKDVLCTLSGSIKKNTIKISTGDKVSVEISTYDTSKGRITYRQRINI